MQSRAFPELNLLDSARERRKVSRTAHLSVMRTRSFWLSWFGAAVTAVSGVVFTVVVFIPWLRQYVSLPDWLVKIVMAFLITGIAAGGWQFTLRRPIRRRIREELLARGIPVCLACGYSLRGQTGPRCPECGRAFDPQRCEHAGSP
ncbi:MAG: hypothetical protein ACYSU7_14525 [Planctomycetota bacterium]